MFSVEIAWSPVRFEVLAKNGVGQFFSAGFAYASGDANYSYTGAGAVQPLEYAYEPYGLHRIRHYITDALACAQWSMSPWPSKSGFTAKGHGDVSSVYVLEGFFAANYGTGPRFQSIGNEAVAMGKISRQSGKK